MAIKGSSWIALGVAVGSALGMFAYSKRAGAKDKAKGSEKSPSRPTTRPDPIDIQPNTPPGSRPDPIDVQPSDPEPWRAEYERADIGSQTLFVAALSFVDPLSVSFAADTLDYRGFPRMAEALRERLKVLENKS